MPRPGLIPIHKGSEARARSFVLRLWPEPREFEHKQPIWRGSVAELDGSNTRYFASANGLARILTDAIGSDSLLEPEGRSA